MQLAQFTIYEVFGYAFPGTAGFVGLYLAYWTFFLSPYQDWRTVSSGGFAAILGSAYVLGHFVQAVMNLIGERAPHRKSERRVFLDAYTMAPEVRVKLVKEAYRTVGMDAPEASLLLLDKTENVTEDNQRPLVVLSDFVYDVADHYIQQKGKTESRDIYLYREGFYRGMSGALLLLVIGSTVRMIEAPASLHIFGTYILLTRSALLCAGALCGILAYLSYQRYLRFVKYRAKFAYYGFLVKAGPE